MTDRVIGYYVHHHGDGHRQRALAIAEHLDNRIVLLGTGIAGRTGGVPYVDLPDDRRTDAGFAGRDSAGTRPAALHYAPIDHDGIRRRVAAVAGWIAEAKPALMIVDVSVEIAMLARLASVPTVPIRLGGVRDDAPHAQAFEAAAAILCPFHALLDEPAVPASIRAKTLHAPGLVRRPPVMPIDPDLVLVVLGRGGGIGDGAVWAEAAWQVPERRWRVIGPCSVPGDLPENLDLAGWITDPEREMAAAGVVVGAAGDGVVGAVLAARRPFVCLPEDRPFDEQRSKARALARAGAAVVSETTPAPAAWRTLLDSATRLDPAAAARLDDPDAARRIARHLVAMADGPSARSAAA